MEMCDATDVGIAKAIDILEKGGVIAHATETCYGLACDLTNHDAVRRLFELKRRPNHMPISALFSSIEEVKKYVEWNDTAERLARKYLPGPLTLVLPVQNQELYTTPKENHSRTVGIRISSDHTANELARRFGKPLSTTSANIHGKPEPYSPLDITPEADLILDSGLLPHNKPSTIVHVAENRYTILRKGCLDLD